MTQFAPTPMHGAAYAVVIEAIGGIQAIADCDTAEKHADLKATLDKVLAWSQTLEPSIREAYRYGVERVATDLQGRLSVHENSRAVRSALKTLPKPEQGFRG